jgi:hypothetical protein
MNIQESRGGNVGKILSGTLMYESDDCSGTPYLNAAGSILPNMIVYSYYNEKFFSVSNLNPQSNLDFQSYGYTKDQGCVQNNTGGGVYSVTEFSLEDFPFTLPINLPIRYEAQ